MSPEGVWAGMGAAGTAAGVGASGVAAAGTAGAAAAAAPGVRVTVAASGAGLVPQAARASAPTAVGMARAALVDRIGGSAPQVGKPRVFSTKSSDASRTAHLLPRRGLLLLGVPAGQLAGGPAGGLDVAPVEVAQLHVVLEPDAVPEPVEPVRQHHDALAPDGDAGKLHRRLHLVAPVELELVGMRLGERVRLPGRGHRLVSVRRRPVHGRVPLPAPIRNRNGSWTDR